MFKRFFNREVIEAVMPIWLGYLPLGMAGGVLSQKVGLTPLEIGFMSLIVFAGSGQFIALAMMGSGQSSIPSIVLTTFIVNLRHLLYSSTLAAYVMQKSAKYLGVFAQGITDETFAVNMNRFINKDSGWDTSKALGVNVLAHSCWIFSNVLGNIIGNVIVIDMALVSYTLTAMFIGLWSFNFNSRLLVIIGFLGGFLAAGLAGVLDHKANIVAGTIIAATAGCILETWGEKR